MSNIYIIKDNINTMLEDHQEWLDSNGKKGKRLVIDSAIIRNFLFKCSNLKKAVFKNTKFEFISFYKCNLLNSKFENCEFNSVSINNCYLINMSIKSSVLNDVEFLSSDILNSFIYNCFFNKVCFDNSYIAYSYMHVNLTKSCFNGTEFMDCYINGFGIPSFEDFSKDITITYTSKKMMSDCYNNEENKKFILNNLTNTN